MLKILLLAAALLPGSAAWADERGSQLAGACQGCHGAAGQGSEGIPLLAGNSTRAELEAMLKAFRANERPGTVMGRIARGYSDAEIAALAQYYAKR
jgi:sulfide dehydrogenase cytochrome subunit